MRGQIPPLGAAERRLLCNCARLEMDAAVRADTEALLRQPLDWDAILFHARLHSVGSLLHRWVKRCDDHVQTPAAARQGLLRLYHAADYRNRLFAREHLRIVEALDQAGVPVIIPKGLSLLDEVYGSLALRPLIDLIFLVPMNVTRGTVELGFSIAPPVPITIRE